MDAALAHPRMAGADVFYLEVWEGNLDAQRFYKRHGFEIVGEREFFVASGAKTGNELIMARRAPRRNS